MALDKTEIITAILKEKQDQQIVDLCAAFDEKLKGNKSTNEPLKRMKNLELVYTVDMHGLLGNDHDDWTDPIVAIECDKEARPGYNSMKAHEYEDDPKTLLKKMKVLADLFRKSKLACAYTGAGISTSSGIGDYASKAQNSKSGVGDKQGKKLKGLNCLPSLGHRTLAQLWRAGHLKHWIQQNHDGLPQKAGFPQHEINEIHGAWFDPSNPVVPMSGSLRGDLCDWLETWENKADLTIAMGTSLCGMSADCMVETVAERYIKESKGLGAVIVGLQRTQYDKICSLRIFAKIDDVCALLARELGVTIPPYKTFVPDIPKGAEVKECMYRVPYDKKGNLTAVKEDQIIWDLRIRQKVKVTSGPGKNYEGSVTGRSGDHYKIKLPFQREKHKNQGKTKKTYTMGSWWVECAVHGRWPKLPVVNLKPKLQINFEG